MVGSLLDSSHSPLTFCTNAYFWVIAVCCFTLALLALSAFSLPFFPPCFLELLVAGFEGSLTFPVSLRTRATGLGAIHTRSTIGTILVIRFRALSLWWPGLWLRPLIHCLGAFHYHRCSRFGSRILEGGRGLPANSDACVLGREVRP